VIGDVQRRRRRGGKGRRCVEHDDCVCLVCSCLSRVGLLRLFLMYLTHFYGANWKQIILSMIELRMQNVNTILDLEKLMTDSGI
jgi:hypothetical protein